MVTLLAGEGGVRRGWAGEGLAGGRGGADRTIPKKAQMTEAHQVPE